MATKPGIDQGKRAFVEDYLKKKPGAQHPEIAQAWEDDHREGTISQSYVGKLRSDLGLTRRSRPSSKAKSEGGTAPRPVGPTCPVPWQSSIPTAAS